MPYVRTCNVKDCTNGTSKHIKQHAHYYFAKLIRNSLRQLAYCAAPEFQKSKIYQSTSQEMFPNPERSMFLKSYVKKETTTKDIYSSNSLLHSELIVE
jgi:hypothetical protein